MSKEHIWGNWLKAYIPQERNKHSMQAMRINRPGELTSDNVFLRAGDPLRSSVKVVCEDCNNQWLNDIQNRAKPFLILLIKGERTGLGPGAQERVAAWCAMATMTAEFIDRDPNNATRGAIVLGGLMSYGALTNDMYRAAGIYSGRILKGATSAALPVMPPARFEFVINKTTAKALRITVPGPLLARADEIVG